MTEDDLIEAKNGEQDIDVTYWADLFGLLVVLEPAVGDPMSESEHQDYLADQERQYIADARADYGGI